MYKFIIKNFDDSHISLRQNSEEITVSLSDFTNRFYSSRNFAFVDHFLPKVLAYFSPSFDYLGHETAFLITQMRPTNRPSVSEDIVFPWSFFFVLVDLQKLSILESHLFFGDSQMLSEDQHKFYVPKTDHEKLAKSAFFENVLNIELNSFASVIPYAYTKHIFGKLVNEFHELSLKAFLNASSDQDTIDWVHLNELKDLDQERKEEIERKFSTYWNSESFISSEIFDYFSLKMHKNPPSFLTLTESFFDKK